MWVKPAVSLNTIHLKQNGMRRTFTLQYLLSPLSVGVGVYPDFVSGEVAVSVQVGGAASLDADQVHVIAI